MPNIKPWEDLANAIILQALEDYSTALRALRRNPWLRDPAREKRAIESFFRSRWFRTLSGADGEALLAKIRKEISP